VSALVAAIVERFEAARDPASAQPMARYMRDQFPFLGISSGPRRALQRQSTADTLVERDALLAAVEQLWPLAEREYQYAACDLLVRHVKLLDAGDLDLVGRLVTTKSWWDTVDALAINVVGPLVLGDRPAGDRVIDRWIDDDDLWLARTAILHQNRWRERTDERRLFELCQRRAMESDFFIRKAIGWALREYSKTAPEAVRGFIAAHDDALSGLSKREALKVIDRDS
jgi:3-methyladenine DNA glycosylase AlkD